ncbi:hypothetical protein, partial [Escherichia coli]|uniref:hypothetical protein n=1 Tax=Escherichia coli TaxID=562 RepID=UPI00200C3A47
MVDSPRSLATFKNPNATDAQIRKDITNWMRYGDGEEASRFSYGAQLAAQVRGRGQSLKPTTGMTQGSIEQQEQLSALGAQWNSQL